MWSGGGCPSCAAGLGASGGAARWSGGSSDPGTRERRIGETSLFYKLFLVVHHGLAWVYEKLHLDKLFAGSVFCRPFFWCALPVVLSPLIASDSGASILVLLLSAVGYASLLLAFVRDRERTLYYAPMDRWIFIYAAVYLAAAWFSVARRSSLKVGALSVAFLLFSVALQNAVRSRRQLDGLIRAMVLVGALVALYGVCQYLFGWGYQSAAWVDSDMFSSITFRVPSTFGNPNMLGQYFILIIPFGGACLLTARHWDSRLVLAGLLRADVRVHDPHLLTGGVAGPAVCRGGVLRAAGSPVHPAGSPRPCGPGAGHAGYGDQPLYQYRQHGGRLHLLPGLHLDGSSGHAEEVLALRHRPGAGGLRSGLPSLQLQLHRGAPLP